MRAPILSIAALAAASSALVAQRPTLAPAVRQFVQVDTSVVALTHVRVIDGTGAPARDGSNDRSFATAASPRSAPSSSTSVPAGAQVMDLTGKSVIPGLVMVHEHLFYPTGPGVYA